MADDDGNCGLGASDECRVTLYKNRNKDGLSYKVPPATVLAHEIGMVLAGVLSKMKISVYGTTAYRPISIFLFLMPFCLIEKRQCSVIGQTCG